MLWNWQQPDWPHFTWNSARLKEAEERFLLGSGILIGTAEHLAESERLQLTASEMSLDAITTSEIEGEFLNRASVQSSIQRQLGLATDKRRIGPAEQGISELVVSSYSTAEEPLSEDLLRGWHRMVMSGRRDLRDVGGYRTSADPMQVVSGRIDAPIIHFEAPPARRVPEEMRQFIEWFNRTAAGGREPLPAVTRAGLAHLYFESIHPFEDGNGRIGRAIAEKALVQGFGKRVVIGLGAAILARHREYYAAFEAANQRNEVTEWLAWIAGVSIEAQLRTTARVQLMIAQTKLFDALEGQLNARQTKVLLRMMREGPEGFEGGLSAKNYATIAGSSSATTTRDLGNLADLGALIKSGERKHTRYALNLPVRTVPRIAVEQNGKVTELPNRRASS